MGEKPSGKPAVQRPAFAGLGTASLGSASLVLSGGIARAAYSQASTPLEYWAVDDYVGTALMLACLGIGLWLTAWAAIASAYLAAAALGLRARRTEALIAHHAPAMLRRFVVAAVGVGLAVGAAPAFAAPDGASPPDALDLGWSTSAPDSQTPRPPAPSPASVPAATRAPPTAPTSNVVPRPRAKPPATRSASDGAHTSVVVVRGDSLWSIAAAHLPQGASDAEIATAWPLWYRTNASVIGADPGRIMPGQVLAPPA